MSRRGWLLFAAMGVIWGVPYLMIKVAVGGVSVPVLVFTRTALGALLLLPFAARPGAFGTVRRYWKPLVAFAAAEMIGPWFLLSEAEKRLDSSTSGLLVAAVPVLGAFLAMARGGERLNRVRWVGLLLGLGGVALLAGPAAFHGDVLSVAATLLVALGYATGPMIADARLREVPSLLTATTCLAFAAVCYAPFAAATWPSRLPETKVLLALGGLSVICTAAAFVVFFRLIAEVGPARSTLITYVNPAVAVAAGVLVLGEALTAGTVAAFALILTGCYLATRPAAPAQPPPAPAPTTLEAAAC